MAEMTEKKRIFALGFFDGVHVGHQALLKACCDLALETGAEPAAITFATHPDALVFGKAPGMLNTMADREKLLRRYGMQAVFPLAFDRQTMTMPWQAFFRMLREDFGAAGLVCGSDFRFGYKGEGTAEKLRAACEAAGMCCAVVPEQTVDGVRVSSTYIRQLLEAGEMEQAVRFLGHPHLLSGTVVSGRQLGRTIGIPTANVRLEGSLLIPRFGVYCCRALVGDRAYGAVTNIGVRPTVGGTHVTVEPWLLEFEGDLYGQELTLEFFAFLRPEKKFDSLLQLQEEVRRNAAQTLEFLKNK